MHAEVTFEECSACAFQPWPVAEPIVMVTPFEGTTFIAPIEVAYVIPTNEELMIARHTGVLLGLVDARARAART